MSRRVGSQRLFNIAFQAGLVLFLSGCLAQGGTAPSSIPTSPVDAKPGMIEQAAQQATAIIAQAQATALVLKAQSQATALVEQASRMQVTPAPGEGEDPPAVSVVSAASSENPSQAGTQTATPSNQGEYQVELVSVGFAAEGNLIIVQFKATRKAVDDFWPGRLSVTDEASGKVYNDVPAAPVVGLLIGRPARPGQLGYVMFTNTPPGLPPGSLVTVKLGKFEKQHVLVSNTIH